MSHPGSPNRAPALPIALQVLWHYKSQHRQGVQLHYSQVSEHRVTPISCSGYSLERDFHIYNMDPSAATDSATVGNTTSSSDVEGVDNGVIAGVIAAVIITVLIVLALIAVYFYKHKGSYRTHETVEEDDEANKALQMNSEPCEEKPEYLM